MSTPQAAKAQPAAESSVLGARGIDGSFDPATFDPSDYTWLRLVSQSGDEGEKWVEAHEKTPVPALIERSDEALFLLRRGQREEGRAKLVELRRDIEALEVAEPELPVVISRRWLHGTEAFLHYLDGDFEAALAALDAAERAVAGALALHSFLMPLAYQALDFVVQRARVARNERRWRELRQQLNRARDMVADTRPLFVLADGREVFSHMVVDFYRSCRLSASDRKLLEFFYGEGRPVRRFEAKVARIAMPSGFVVPYH